MEKQFDSGISLKIVKNEWDVYFDMAMVMLEEVMHNNASNKQTVMIVPVGPTQQYPILAELVNRLGVSFKNVHFFNMDEYLLTPEQVIAQDDALSFQRRMNEEFYSRVKPRLLMPESQRHFPKPGCEHEYDQLIAGLGGVDLCLGGLGINGHIAFNEAAEIDDPITIEAFAALGTRVLPISRETRAINARGYLKGDVYAMPQWCITVGMKQILSARRIYIALNCDWQHGIARRALRDRPQPQIPASLLQGLPNVLFCTTEAIADGL